MSSSATEITWTRSAPCRMPLSRGSYGTRSKTRRIAHLQQANGAGYDASEETIPVSLDRLADLVIRAAGAGMRVAVADICSIVERGLDAAWRDQQRVRGVRLLRETAKAQARFDRWIEEAKWVLAQRDRLELSPGLVAALEAETCPRTGHRYVFHCKDTLVVGLPAAKVGLGSTGCLCIQATRTVP